MQHPGVAEAVEADLRSLGVVGPILKRLAPGLDAGAVLAEIRERISDELDYEVEAQHQRRLERLFRGHPHVRVPRVHTDLSARRVLVTEYVDGLRGRRDRAPRRRGARPHRRDRLPLLLRPRAGATAPSPATRTRTTASSARTDGCACSTSACCATSTPDYLEGERDVMRALADGDAQRVHDGLSSLGYLPEPGAFDPDALLEHLATAGEWMLAPGFRRVDPEYVAQILRARLPAALTVLRG